MGIFGVLFTIVFFSWICFSNESCGFTTTQNIARLVECREKIVDFVAKNKASFRVPDLILLDYIKRKFNLPEDFGFERSFTRATNPTAEDIAYLRVYGRMVNYKGIEYKKPTVAEPFVWSEIEAIFIDKPENCPEKERILRALENQLEGGRGYEVTHTALALGLYIERKCLNSDDPAVKVLIHKVCDSLQYISNSIVAPTDLKLESLCFLCYLNHKEKVNFSELERLLEYQRPDGAFSGSSNPNSGINVHTTLLALWILCEFTIPNVNQGTTMIRTP